MLRTLPPGQRRIDGFPRFGAHLGGPNPPIPIDPVIEVRGAVRNAFEIALARLADLPSREVVADFHCVAGWTATGLSWEGVRFGDFYRELIEPALAPDSVVTHIVFGGLDRQKSVLTIDDALADDVLIAERLNGHPLDADHGAPARLVSPGQYGYKSLKYLCRIDVRTAEPTELHPYRISNLFFRRHPRARVWHEERHSSIPVWLIRPAYRALIRPFIRICARGSDGTSAARD